VAWSVGGVRFSSDLIAFIVWSGAMFGLGFAAGWFAKRRTVHRKAKSFGTLH
jgi:hypothetical protein